MNCRPGTCRLRIRWGRANCWRPARLAIWALRKTQDYVARHPEIGNKVAQSLDRAGLIQLDGVRVRPSAGGAVQAMSGWPASSRWPNGNGAAGRIACYYGCQAVRPYDEVDKPHNPTRMDELLGAIGAPTVDYSLKTKCCGGSLTGTLHEVGLRLNYILLKEAARKGAEAIVTLLPAVPIQPRCLPGGNRQAERRAIRHAGALLHAGVGVGRWAGSLESWG